MAAPRKLLSIPLWNGPWSEEALRRRHANDARGYARGFHLRAYSDEEKLFTHFSSCWSESLTAAEIIKRPYVTAMGVDLSSKKRPGTAISVMMGDVGSSRKYVIDIRFGAWTSPQTAEQIAICNALFRPLVIVVEDNGYQASLIEWIQASKGSNDLWTKIEASTTVAGYQLDEERGLAAIEIEFQNKAWTFPAQEWTHPDGRLAQMTDKGTRGQWARLRNEFFHYPFAGTSDGVMATWFARQGLEKFMRLARGNAGTIPSHRQ